MICLSDITLIQNLESQIRRKLSERGLKARYTFDDILHESGTMKETIETVSYTHLDVYKRQNLTLGGRKIEAVINRNPML